MTRAGLHTLVNILLSILDLRERKITVELPETRTMDFTSARSRLITRNNAMSAQLSTPPDAFRSSEVKRGLTIILDYLGEQGE